MGWFISIVVCVAIVSILSFDWKKKKDGKIKISSKGVAFIIFNLLIILFSALQYRQNDQKIEANNVTAREEQVRRDSISKAHYDTSLKREMREMTGIMSDMLGKYGFKFDSVNKLLLTVDPVFQICAGAVDGIQIVEGKYGKKIIRLKICSKDAGIGGFHINIAMVTITKTIGLKYQGIKEFNEPDFKLNAGGRIEKDFDIFDYEDILKIYIMIKGVYWNTDKSKSLPINELYYYDTQAGETERKFGFITGDEKNEVLSVIYKNNPKLKNPVISQ